MATKQNPQKRDATLRITHPLRRDVVALRQRLRALEDRVKALEKALRKVATV